MFSIGKASITKEDILKKTSEGALLTHYTDIKSIPCRINSPFRNDKNPSLGFYYKDGKILWTDFKDNSGGDIFMFLAKLWNMSMSDTLYKINKDIIDCKDNLQYRTSFTHEAKISTSKLVDLKFKTRNWNDYDIEYWKSFGISLEWLKFADVYPVSRIFFIKNDKTLIVPADKYAYAYVEFKEGKQSIKVYQPLNTNGFKWINKHDKSVIGLWTKLPTNGEVVCICSSVKDALCLWSNTGIPSICVQGEGYPISKTACNELKRRFRRVYILFDNDEPGLEDSLKLSQSTGFDRLILPKYNNAKDISDMYKSLPNKEQFKQIITNLFKF